MKIGDLAEYILFRSAIGTLRLLPVSWSQRLCRGAAWLVGSGLGYRRQVVRRQLAMVYPGLGAGAIARLAAAVYAHLGDCVAETFCADPADLAARVQVVPGWEPLDRALAAGRGVIVVTGHLGNFELGGRILASRHAVLDVVKPMRNRRFDHYLQRLRQTHGIRTVVAQDAGRAVVAHLRSGGVVTLLVDQDAGREGACTGFLGHPASTWPGAARLALRTGAPVVPLAILRGAGGWHELRIGDALDCATGGDEATDIETLTARISAAVEAYILDRPEQWFWVHRRWKGATEAGFSHGTKSE
jgi:KDO2-lipid IV(A) lauroyltransferase